MSLRSSALCAVWVLQVCATNRPEDAGAADTLILPGVGHSARSFRSGEHAPCAQPLRDAIARGMPLLGICLGLQALFATSDEAPGDAGLGLFPAASRMPPTGRELPHMGWNQLRRMRTSHLCSKAFRAEAYFYFAHSYAALTLVAESVAICDHGRSFIAVVEQRNVFGMQFHPEKVGAPGASCSTIF